MTGRGEFGWGVFKDGETPVVWTCILEYQLGWFFALCTQRYSRKWLTSYSDVAQSNVSFPGIRNIP